MVTVTDKHGEVLAKLSLWIPQTLMSAADEACRERMPSISKTQWMKEAIVEKLQRDSS